MKRLALLILFACGCASTQVPQMTPGAEFADHHLSLRPLVSAEVDAPTGVWPGEAHHHHTGDRSAVSTGPLSATAWLWFRAYQNTLSRVDGATCRFRPTCSGFAAEAISEHGLLGLAMAFGRLARNHNGVRHYRVSEPPYLDDPVENYGFGGRRPWLDDFQAHEDEAHAWYQHVRATRRLR